MRSGRTELDSIVQLSKHNRDMPPAPSLNAGKEGRTCIFCGSGEGLSGAGEHVLPKWLQIQVGGSLKGGFQGVHMSPIGHPISRRKASGNSLTLGSVCTRCNNGWMSRLENSFGMLLPRLQANPSPALFSKAERHTIAIWILKTAIVAHRSSNYRKILPDAVPLALTQGKTIPGGVAVFSGKSETAKEIEWHQSSIFSCRVRQTDINLFDARQDTFVFALALSAVVLCVGWHGVGKDFEIIGTDDTVHQIYPRPKLAKRIGDMGNPTGIATSLVLTRRRG